MTQYPLHRGLGASQGQFGWVWKILPPTRIPPYADYAILADANTVSYLNYSNTNLNLPCLVETELFLS